MRHRRLRQLWRVDWELAAILKDAAARAAASSHTARLVEIGCANSVWLPLLATETGADVWGVDFSEAGCRLAERNLAGVGATGTIVQDDFFAFSESQPGAFDLVMSFGFIEHFEDVSSVLVQMTRLLRSGGTLVATVPNLSGLLGPIQRFLDPEVFAGHVLLTPEVLADCGRRAGLDEIEVGYIGGAFRLSALNIAHGRLPRSISRIATALLFEIDALRSAMPGRRRSLPRTAPYQFLRAIKR